MREIKTEKQGWILAYPKHRFDSMTGSRLASYSFTLAPFADERTFPCTILTCKRTFKKVSDMQQHMRKSHNAMPYACERCGHKFDTRTAVVEHQKRCNVGSRREQANNEVESAADIHQVRLFYSKNRFQS